MNANIYRIPSRTDNVIPIGQPRDYPEAVDLYASFIAAAPELYIDELRNRRRPTLDRIADALGSRDFLLVYMGIVGGALLTVGCAFCWSVLS
jgi:hypothetical protein